MKNRFHSFLVVTSIAVLAGCGKQDLADAGLSANSPAGGPPASVHAPPAIALTNNFLGTFRFLDRNTPVNNSEKVVMREHIYILTLKPNSIAIAHSCRVKVTNAVNGNVTLDKQEMTGVESPFTLLAPNRIRVAQTKKSTVPFNPYPQTFESCPTTLTAGDYTFSISSNGVTLLVERPDTFVMPEAFLPTYAVGN